MGEAVDGKTVDTDLDWEIGVSERQSQRDSQVWIVYLKFYSLVTQLMMGQNTVGESSLLYRKYMAVTILQAKFVKMNDYRKSYNKART